VELEDEKQRAESDFFEYVATSYRYFLAGDDRQCEQVDGAKAAEFEERADEIRAHNDAVQKAPPPPPSPPPLTRLPQLTQTDRQTPPGAAFKNLDELQFSIQKEKKLSRTLRRTVQA
jgi:hypothetical protein